MRPLRVACVALKQPIRIADQLGLPGIGYETALNMYDWVANNKEPEKLILTAGALAKRDDYQKVRQGLGIE